MHFTVNNTGDAPFLHIPAFISSGTVIHGLSEGIPEERGGSFASVLIGGAVYRLVLLVA